MEGQGWGAALQVTSAGTSPKLEGRWPPLTGWKVCNPEALRGGMESPGAS